VSDQREAVVVGVLLLLRGW